MNATRWRPPAATAGELNTVTSSNALGGVLFLPAERPIGLSAGLKGERGSTLSAGQWDENSQLY
jgi:hypothetical protein